MTNLFTWSSSADTFTTTVGTAPSVENLGSYGERTKWPSTTAAANARATITATTAFGCRFIYTLASFSGGTHTIMAGFAAGTTQQFKLDILNTGLLRMRDTTTTVVASGTQAMLVNVEYRFEVYRSGSSLTVKMYRASDNTLIDSITGTVGTADITLVLFGNNATLTGTLGSFTFDEVIVTNTAAEVGPPTSTIALSATAAVSPPSSAAPYTLTLTISASGGTGAFTYAVTNWGDGSTSASQSSNVFTKTIASGTTPGTKTITYTVTG